MYVLHGPISTKDQGICVMQNGGMSAPRNQMQTSVDCTLDHMDRSDDPQTVISLSDK